MSDEKWTDPITIGEDMPQPIWFAKAAFQLGHNTVVRKVENGSYEIRLPSEPAEAQGEITERARWLEEREAKGLPVDPLPSGRFPDDPEEFGDQIPVVVVADTERVEVYIDFARPIRALGISPAMARTIALKLNQVADLIDPDGSLGMQNPTSVTIGHIRVPGSDAIKEGVVVTPGLVDDLKVGDRLDPDDEADEHEAALQGFPIVGICDADGCREAQYGTPSGPVCKWGHGGTKGTKPCWACTYDVCDEDADFCKCGRSIKGNAEFVDCDAWTADPQAIKCIGGG